MAEKEKEKIEKYEELRTALSRQWNVQMTVVPVVIDALGMVADLSRARSRAQWIRKNGSL